MKKATIQLGTLTCPSCMMKIENGVKSLSGVDADSVTVSFNSSKVKLNFDDEKVSIEEVQKIIDKLGYDVKSTQVKEL